MGSPPRLAVALEVPQQVALALLLARRAALDRRNSRRQHKLALAVAHPRQ